MRHPALLALCLLGTGVLTACERGPDAEAARAAAAVNVIDETNLNEIMLTVADPGEAVAYFRRAVEGAPDRPDLRRGLARSLIRAGRTSEAVAAWTAVADHPEATDADRVDLADALIRAGEWERAAAVLNAIPPTHETFQRYRLEAMVADSRADWVRADAFYETAIGLAARPAGVLNNWGFSKLTRGAFGEAERLFGEALSYDPNLFTAKNNLVLARAAQRKYDLPVVRMSQIERAQLLHTAALAAIKQGDLAIGKALLQQAIETHPQHFEAAVRALEALEGGTGQG